MAVGSSAWWSSGFGIMVQAACSNTVLQTIVPDEKRGARDELFPDGLPRHRALRQLNRRRALTRIGVSWTIAVGGGCCSVGALVCRRIEVVSQTLPSYHVDLGLVTETQVAEAEMAALALIADDE